MKPCACPSRGCAKAWTCAWLGSVLLRLRKARPRPPAAAAVPSGFLVTPPTSDDQRLLPAAGPPAAGPVVIPASIGAPPVMDVRSDVAAGAAPRSGVGKEVVGALNQLGTPGIVFPATPPAAGSVKPKALVSAVTSPAPAAA